MGNSISAQADDTVRNVACQGFAGEKNYRSDSNFDFPLCIKNDRCAQSGIRKAKKYRLSAPLAAVKVILDISIVEDFLKANQYEDKNQGEKAKKGAAIT